MNDMDKLTVAHFVNPFLPLTQNWIYHQLRFNTECKCIVLCQTRENTAQFPFEKVFAAFPENSLVARVNMQFSRFRARYRKGYYLDVIQKERPDVLHGHFSWESWRNIGVVTTTRLPLVTTFYGLDVNKLPRQWVWRRRYARLFDLGTAFTVEGPCMAKALAAIGCPEEKIRIIPLGVDIEKIAGRRVAPAGETVKILFVGLAREKKGSTDAAAAFARVAQKNPAVELHLLGNGPYASPVRDILRRAGVLRQCIFHGYVPFENYYDLLGQMDIVMAPSVVAKNGDAEGGAPVVVIEAQAAGIPVAGTRHCDIPNIVVDRETGLLCEERDVDSLTANVQTLVDNPGMRRRMGAAARLRAAAQFSIQRQVRDLNKLYRSIVH
jgi:colanic acid/amylovoran biosynthesis glycosyltransferase